MWRMKRWPSVYWGYRWPFKHPNYCISFDSVKSKLLEWNLAIMNTISLPSRLLVSWVKPCKLSAPDWLTPFCRVLRQNTFHYQTKRQPYRPLGWWISPMRYNYFMYTVVTVPFVIFTLWNLLQFFHGRSNTVFNILVEYRSERFSGKYTWTLKTMLKNA